MGQLMHPKLKTSRLPAQLYTQPSKCPAKDPGGAGQIGRRQNPISPGNTAASSHATLPLKMPSYTFKKRKEGDKFGWA